MDLKPKDIINPKSLHNAMVTVMALGGSTNALLHLIAIARLIGTSGLSKHPILTNMLSNWVRLTQIELKYAS